MLSKKHPARKWKVSLSRRVFYLPSGFYPGKYICYWLKEMARKKGGRLNCVDVKFLLLVSFIVFMLYRKALFILQLPAFRNVYSGMLLKLFACAAGAFVYIITDGNVNKPALFVCLFLYLLYTI
jgi:hypothetical protein